MSLHQEREIYVRELEQSNKALLEALEDAKGWVAHAPDEVFGMAVGGSGPDAYEYPIRHELLAKIDAALKKAKP